MIIKEYIKKEQEKDYVMIPFSVDDDVEKIEVAYRVDARDATIDIGVKDPKRIRGFSGGARDNFYICLDHATPGYISGELMKGQWEVILGTYEVPQDGCMVTLEINVVKKHRQWLKGDTHTHTFHSDGKYSLDDASRLMHEQHMDFIICTDHTTVSHHNNLPTDKGLIFIEGVELTTYKGHSNIVGIKNFDFDFRVLNNEDVYAVFEQAKKQGGYIGINHPYHKGNTWQYAIDLDVVDWIEVWNGPMHDDNYEAVKLWQQMLQEGYQVPAVGGSDVHRDDIYVKHGIPSLYVLAQSYCKHDILEAMKKGNSYMSIFDTHLEFYTEHNVIGEKTTDESVTIEIEGLAQADVVHIIGSESYQEIEIKDTTTFQMEKAFGTDIFLRVEVKRFIDVTNRHETILLSNPIYK